MKTIKIILFGVSLALLASSCYKEDELKTIDNIPGLGGDTWAQGPIDKWLYDSLTLPYNIAAKYKWDQGELQEDLDRTLTPVKEEQVLPVMSAIRKVWINTYIAEAGLPFFKKITPKFFVLVGSGAYQRGSIKLGTAEGGRKITIYGLNNFRSKGMPGYVPADTAEVKKMFWIINHEFAHILDQTIDVPVSFSQSSASSYTSDWLNVTKTEAQNEGFISQYAISAAVDDWAETVSFMLVEGKLWFDQYVNSINYAGTTPNGTTAAQARSRLREKEAAVVTYFKQAWNIDFYSLQARTRAAMNAILY